MGFELAGLIWERPLAWWGLCLPALVLLAAKQPLRPRVMATGALSLWRRVLESPGGGDGERPQVPRGIWWLCAGLTLGVLAMAGPRSRAAGVTRTWTVVVDRSPGTYLAVDAPATTTRLTHGLELLEEEWRGLVRDGDVVRWFDGTEWVESADFPEPWRSAPRAPRRAPDWERWDAPGSVWLCARPPEREPSEASLCASGGRAAPGPVAIDGEDRLDWSGGRLVRVIGGAPRRCVRVIDVGGDLVDFIKLWAEERGLELTSGAPSEDDVLLISGGSVSGGVTSQSGALTIGIADESLGERDPAEFALLWSERLDEACIPAAGLSPVSGRAPIGNEIWNPGRAPDERSDGGLPGRAWEGWLALLSCGLVAVALVGFPR